ncbi:MAG TPA: SDR family NAD(P)-dependent oxidoreductase [bacterium]|nr:SDR family NAD(P)-dependent oxidoreductase [bacterium]
MRGLRDKVAIVTGAGQGIGRAIALRLAHEGADLVIADLNTKTASGVAAEVETAGRRAATVRTDVAAAADRRALVDAAVSAFGRIDVLVNNAGIIRLSGPLDITEEEWDLVQAVNLKGTYFMCQAVLPHMLERGAGRIVNIASIAAKAGSVAWIHYNVSKAGVVALTRNLAMAYGRRGINVNCVCPGIVDTEMWAKIEREAGRILGLGPGELTDSRLKTIALGRLEKPEDVADAVAFLCSDDARYITGQAINVEGGILFH